MWRALADSQETGLVGTPSFGHFTMAASKAACRRVGGRIFALLGHPEHAWGTVLLPPEEQERLVEEDREQFLGWPEHE